MRDQPGPPDHEAVADLQAEAWLNASPTAMEPAPPKDPQTALALGWALKRAAQRSWHSEPARAHRAAAGLGRLTAAFPAQAGLAALRCWTAGFAALVDGDMAEALRQLEEAGHRLEAMDRPVEAAQARLPMLMALSMLGRTDEAVALADALEAPLAAAGDVLSAGKVALNRGSMLMRLDRYDAAAEGYRQASAHFARAGDATHGIMADIGLAGALTWRYRFDEAEAIVEAARQQASAQGLHVLEALAAGEIGQLQLHNGRVAAALQAFEQAVQLLTGRAPPQRLLEAERARAEALLAVGLWPEAAAACARMVDAAQAMQAPVEAAWSRMMRGQALGEAGDRPGAEADLTEAAASFEQLGNAVGIGRARLLQARLAQAGGDAARALALAAEAAALLGKAGLTRWRLDAQLVQASAALALGDAAGAQTLLAAVAGDATDAPALAATAALRAHAAAQAGDTVQARAHANDALVRFDQLRRQVPAGDMRIASLHGAEAVADLWVRLHDAPGEAPEALLSAIERGRSRALHDDLARSSEPANDAQAAPRARLSWLQHQWNHALAAGESDPARLERLQRLVREAEAQQAHAERLRAASRPVVDRASPAVALADEAAGPSPGAVHALLGDSRALVSFHLDGETWRACVLWRGQCRRLQGQVPGLAGRLASLRLQMDAMRGPAAGQQRHAGQRLERVRRLLAGLHDDLVAPWRAEVAGAAQLVLLPHRALHAIPFAALASAGPALGEAFELVQAPSLEGWLHCMRLAPRPTGPTLAVGAGSAWLPGVAGEARAVAALHGPDARLLVDDTATLARWRSEAPGAAVLHLACHARARPDNPAFSALQLADGALTLAEVSATGLRAGLVVLSACDTMISRLAPGDEVLGLARGFLLAGARTVVATLWSVPDTTTAGLMADLHAACARGEAPAAALRAARLRLAGRQPHPFHWAPFVVYGAG